MSAKPTTAKKIGVTLVRLGGGSEGYSLPEGATLADLLRVARAQLEGETILINGRPLEESIPLQAGTTVTLVPRAKNPVINERWRETIGMFKDDPTFHEMMEAVQAAREAEREAVQNESENVET